MELDVIHTGDCLQIMKGMEDECVDLVVTDPPYGIAFMGKAWDKALPSVDVWRECLRVLKPGAFAFVMCIPRQDCLSRVIINLEDAGFMVNFSPILWTYATGFPKAANLSKLADKRAGAEREVVGVNPQWCEGRIPTVIAHTSGNTRPFLHDERAAIFKKFITVAATPEAKALEGAYAGYQPKPAYEVIIVVMKPRSEKTYLDQALANGHGCTWLADGRIPYESDGEWQQHIRIDHDNGNSDDQYQYTDHKKGRPVPQGRFAPNLLCSDDVLNDGRVRKSGKGVPGMGGGHPSHIYGRYAENKTGRLIGDSGSYSRYFSLDSWAEKYLPESVNRTYPFMIVPKASKSEKNAGLGGDTCKHPTVKPIKLMSYMIAIGSRPGDVVLDPYGGSGTTGISAALADRRYILCELDAEYVDIAERRIAWHVNERICLEESQLKLDFNENWSA